MCGTGNGLHFFNLPGFSPQPVRFLLDISITNTLYLEKNRHALDFSYFSKNSLKRTRPIISPCLNLMTHAEINFILVLHFTKTH
jgi:hypothetical protein